MGKKIDVILLADISDVGQAGDIVSVAEGFARNMLFPEGLAAIADQNVKSKQAEKTRQKKEEIAGVLAKLQQAASAVDGTELLIRARTKDGYDLYGRISAAMVAAEYNKQVSSAVAAKDIGIKDTITRIGSYDATIDFGMDIEAKIKVTVVPVEAEKGTDDER